MMEEGEVTLLACFVCMAKGLNHHPYYGLWGYHSCTNCLPGLACPWPCSRYC